MDDTSGEESVLHLGDDMGPIIQRGDDSDVRITGNSSPFGCLKAYVLGVFNHFSVGPFFATVGFFLVCLYTNSVMQVFTEKRALANPREPIMDLGFDILHPLPGQREYADLFVVFYCVASFVRFMPTYMRWTFLRRFLFFYGALLLLRSATIILTILPNPYEGCDSGELGSPFYEALRIMVGRLVTCSDMLFSGHTVNLTVCALSWHFYSRVAPIFYFSQVSKAWESQAAFIGATFLWITRVIVWGSACVGYYFIIATRLHYTDDVVIGLYLTFLLWFWYFRCVQSCYAKRNFVDIIIAWVEKDTLDFDLSTGDEKDVPGLIDLSWFFKI
eukprot:TRINITY_DN14296_c0_g1_i1.p1 TRINITY_DN14296_c0_g1~~TRINITY_DN14296_c0_g1_i1.p1  ORF type:complete len:330 (+),score=36.79 TRINITY_DN14296_c0_g1_i1:67-1056(+)